MLLRIFFRRIEIVGQHHLPKDGSLLFTLNHPSGLIDPLFILCLSGRRVSFLAKEPLFRMPVIGTFVKAFESLPVYRTSDGGDPKKNKAMMRAAADLLARGNALALFPEGTSHSDPTLKRFRSGAARIALSARALGAQPVRIVPGAIYYERKQTFRSRAVLAFGAPLEVPLVELNEAGDSPLEAGKALTANLEQAVHSIMPTADSAEGLILAEQAERVFSAAVRQTPERCPVAVASVEDRTSSLTLGQRMARRRRLIDAYQELHQVHPAAVDHLIDRIRDLRERLAANGLTIDAVASSHPQGRRANSRILMGALLLLPWGIVGAALHAPAYQLVRFLGFRVMSEFTDATATVKLIAGSLFFPLTWLLMAAAGIWSLETPAGAVVGLAGPPLGWAAIRFNELAGALRRANLARKSATSARLDWEAVTTERAEIAEEMAALMTQV